jgi:phage head maturation protease
MSDYETMAERREHEDARRGYSIGGGGFVAAVDHRQVVTQRPIRHSANPQVLQGFACLWDVIHDHKGRREMFAKGSFDGSLFGVMFHIDHDLLSKKLGDQDDGNLELIDTDIGLAFKLKLAPGDLERLGGRDELSVMYQERDVEIREIAGETVRVIKSAFLVEISAVFVGAIRKSFSVVRDANAVGLLKDDVNGFASEGAAVGVRRAFRDLMNVL